ncbi:MAG: glycosyltransferase family 4 protein [Rhodospirillales bacterium]
MKILFLTENFPPETNAAATRVYERAVFWAQDGHEVTVLTCAPNFPHGRVFDGYRNRWRQVEMRDGIRVVRVKTFIAPNRGVLLRTLDFLSFFFSAFVVGLMESKPDVIAATSPQFFAAVAGWLLGKARRRPFVFELGDLWPASISAVGVMRENLALRLLEKLELHLYRQSACVVALTHAFKENLIRRGILADKIAVVINGVDLSRYAPRERDANLAEEWDLGSLFTIGYVGTHGMAHGLINVIDAAERLQDIKDLRILLVGSGAEREKVFIAARQRRLENVVLIPPQPKEAMTRVWSLCNVALVHLSDSPVFAEVIPSKIFEAMGMGLPILLASPAGEASRIVEEDEAGLWVPAEDPDALAAAIRRLYADKALRQTLSQKAIEKAPAHSRRVQANKMLLALDMAAQGKGDRVADAVANTQ